MKKEQKIQRAEVLRKQLNKSTRDFEKVADKWIKATKKAKNPTELKKVNQGFEKQYWEADKQESKDYKKYYDFVNKNFKRETIEKCNRGGVFTKKTFTDRLKETV